MWPRRDELPTLHTWPPPPPPSLGIWSDLAATLADREPWWCGEPLDGLGALAPLDRAELLALRDSLPIVIASNSPRPTAELIATRARGRDARVEIVTDS